MSSPRPSWRPLLAGTVALFLIILAFLAGQLRAGGDPALGRTNAATQQAQDDAQRNRQTAPPGFGTDPSAPGQGTDPSAPGQGTAPDPSSGQDPSADDGFVPGGSAPAPPVPDGSSQSSDAPSTHQS